MAIEHTDENEIQSRRGANGASTHTAFEGGHRVPIADRGQEELLNKFCVDFGQSMDAAVEFFEWFDENGLAGKSQGQGDVEQLMLKFRNSFREMIQCENIWLAVWTMAYCWGFDDEINHKNPSQIAVEFGRHNGGLGCHRMNVTKLVERFQKRVGLPKRKGQKTKETCEKLSAKRRANLKTAA